MAKKKKETEAERLDRLINKHLDKKLINALNKVNKQISKEVEQALFEIVKQKSKNPSLALSEIEHYKTINKKVNKIFQNYLDSQQLSIQDLFIEVYQQGIDDVDQQLILQNAPSSMSATVQFAKPNLHLVQATLNEVNTYLKRASEGIPPQIKATINKLVNDKVIKQSISGQSLNRAVKEMVKEIEDKGIKMVTTSKRRYDIKTYSRMILRTESRYMHTQAVKQRTEELGYLYVRISSHPNPSKACEPYEGKIYYVGKNPKDNFLNKTHLDDVTGVKKLFHPNCKHVSVVYPARPPRNK
ncbi:phage minor capsid protein [Paenibacillus sp. FSL H7-0735]|uniref:phage minor capsid protein n=1 Tax=Paenibacillus sp. FSL H7-0735 TaxID=2954736 RepID=UPI0030FCDBB1